MASKQGVSLIELATVVAIISVLAAAAVPRFTDMTTVFQRAMVSGMLSQLNSAAVVYMFQQAARPTGFKDFVGTGNSPRGEETIALGSFGMDSGTCRVNQNKINCNKKVFPDLGRVTYTWENGEVSCSIGRESC